MDTGDSGADSLYWRDEILQILYWLRGEGLGEAVAVRDVLVFLSAEESLVQRHLERLVAEGYALRGDSKLYRLTALGVREGGRRFADEFAGLTGQAHGECADPECACRTLGPQACTTGGHTHSE